MPHPYSPLERFPPNTLIVFANGMVGCVTNNGRIALVDKHGVATKRANHPKLEVYLAAHEIARDAEGNLCVELGQTPTWEDDE